MEAEPGPGGGRHPRGGGQLAGPGKEDRGGAELATEGALSYVLVTDLSRP